MRIYPTSTANTNVPQGAFLLAETSSMSGEIVTTYYIDADANMMAVVDWSGHKPYPVHFSEVCRLTGDTEKMIAQRWAAHKEACARYEAQRKVTRKGLASGKTGPAFEEVSEAA